MISQAAGESSKGAHLVGAIRPSLAYPFFPHRINAPRDMEKESLMAAWSNFIKLSSHFTGWWLSNNIR